MRTPSYYKESAAIKDTTIRLGDKVTIADFSYSLTLQKDRIEYGVGNITANTGTVFTVVAIDCLLPASADSTSDPRYKPNDTIVLNPRNGEYRFVNSRLLSKCN